jgi:hypothetical protein
MRTIADAVIDHLGGTSAVAKLIEAPVSTVHSWRTIGIPSSRMAHLRLVAKTEGKPLPDDLAELLPAGEDEAPRTASAV